LSEWLGATHWATKIHNALSFGEAKGTMNRMSCDVFERRIGRQLGATLRSCPAVDHRHERARYAVTTRIGLDVQALEEHDRRAIRTIDVINTLRGFNEADGSTVCVDGKANKMSPCDGISHVGQVLGLRAWPQTQAQSEPSTIAGMWSFEPHHA